MSSRRNVTVVLDEETARWARIEAARQDTSISRLVGEMPRERMERASAYQAAGERFLQREPYLTPTEGRSLPRSDELYDRGE